MEQFAYLIGIVISGIIAGLGVKASRGDTVEEREMKLLERKTKSRAVISDGKTNDDDEIVRTSISTNNLLAQQQGLIWNRLEAVEEDNRKREIAYDLLVKKSAESEKSLMELRAKVEELEVESEQKDSQISSLERKVAVLRQKLKESGIDITDEELEAEIASADTIIK